MSKSLVPWVFEWPELETFQQLNPFSGKTGDITISEDDQNIYVEMPLPGVESKDVEVTFHKGMLQVKGAREEKEEDKKKKYYRRASATFSYQVAVPGELDESAEPKASCDKGIVRVAFKKHARTTPRRIEVK
ncbi:MAG: Hsp20/alpha crystallin family protein [Verrucomicrobia bacterium]|nr:Hsp20/alpha crystallin family protein [Verrucomicrobiota bacterium]